MMPFANASLTLEIRNTLAELEVLNAQACAFLEGQQASPEALYTISLALEEMITNIIKYGYDDTAEHTIHVHLAVNDVQIEAAIEDDGHPFNPLEAGTPDLQQSIAERQIGGLGIHLVRQMCDELAYARLNERNILTLRVARAKTAPAP